MESSQSELDIQNINEKIIQEIIKNVCKNVDSHVIFDKNAIENEISKLEDELKTINNIMYTVNYDNKTKSDIDTLNKSNEKVKIAIISRITYLKACKYLISHREELDKYIDTVVRAMYK